MENSTKALIIVAGVLIIILIISIAMGVLNIGQSTKIRSEGQLDVMAISIHNERFSNCEGKNLSYVDIKAIISKVANNNDTVTQTGKGAKVLLTVGTYDSASNYKNNRGNGLSYYADDATDALSNKIEKISNYKNIKYDCFIVYDTTNPKASRKGVNYTNQSVINEVIIFCQNF